MGQWQLDRTGHNTLYKLRQDEVKIQSKISSNISDTKIRADEVATSNIKARRRSRTGPCSGKTMAVGDACIDSCTYHRDSMVALYCETCQQLICTKCISRGSSSGALHRDHVYLDLQEAYDIHKVTSKTLSEAVAKKPRSEQSLGAVVTGEIGLCFPREVLIYLWKYLCGERGSFRKDVSWFSVTK